MKRLRIILALIVAVVASPALAVTATTTGYLSKQTLPVGSVVSLSNNPGVVEASKPDSVNNMIGVVAGKDDALISFSSDASASLQVATSGVQNVFVATVNGDIKVGDRITASVIEGVGEKAKPAEKSVGVAQASFSKSSNGAQKQTVVDNKGGKHDFYVGTIEMLIGPTSGTVVTEKSGNAANQAIGAIQPLINAVAGKPVSVVPLLLSVLVFLVSITFAAIVLNSAVRAGIISVGRNPLSQGLVSRTLLRAGLVATAIMVAGGAMIFVLLRFL